MVRAILRNPSDLCIGEFLAQTITNSESLFDGGIQNTLDRIIDHGLNDPSGVFKLISIPQLRMIAAAPYRKLRELLEVQEVSWDEYAAALADWYTLGSITNQNGTMFWCTNCRDDRVSCNLDARLAPDNLSLPCPRCKGSMHFVTAYFVAPWLREVLFSKD